MQEQSQLQSQEFVTSKRLPCSAAGIELGARPPSPRRRRTGVPAWFASARRGRSGNDDDPPPSPAMIAAPALLAWHDIGSAIGSAGFVPRLAA
jgi:hypothetical protein